MIRVLIVEDQRLMRETMENYICRADGYVLAGSLGRASRAKDFCAANQVDLVLMDVCTENDESGFTATEELKSVRPGIKVVIVTSMLDSTYLVRAKDAGAEGFWYKDAPEAELMSVIAAVVNGETVYPDKPPRVEVGAANNYDFSEAELRVLRPMVEGDSYAEIAKKLNISPETVKTHVSHMLQKTGFKSKTQLVAQIIKKNVIVNGY